MSRFRDAYMDEQAEQKVDERVEEYKQTMEWFDWFVTTEEYKELIKEISKNPTHQTSPNSSGENGSPSVPR
jgi:uncharacterized Zn finger protein